MKIGILTQPLHTNYGGLLQAYALQTVLKRMGHEVWTVDRPFKKISLLRKILSIIKRSLISVFCSDLKVIRVWPTDKEYSLISQNTDRFIEENIKITETINSPKEFISLKKYEFEAYIVGSDQVWRPFYSPCITNYFLDFIKNNENVKRIAYAASFGVDKWEFTDAQTATCATLVQKFNAISVREDSAITLCKDYFGVKAEHVLDPTMLLTKEDYVELVRKDNIPKSKGNLMTYVLDKSSDKEEIISKVSIELGLIPFSVMPLNRYSEVRKKDIKNCVFPPLTEWIRGFMDAEFVVTDSFHGTVFSIIFNKPFIAIGNAFRGNSRFISLLSMFGLESRLVLSIDEVTSDLIKATIDFARVNMIRNKYKKSSIDFLCEALTK